MAYAALLSLTQTLDKFLLSHHELLDLEEELQIRSLHQKLILFISFLEETSQKNSVSIEDLEERIRDAVYEAEDIVESYMSKKILSKSESWFWDFAIYLIWMYQQFKEDNDEYLEEKNCELGLQNVMEKLDSVWREVEKMKDKNKIEAPQIKVASISEIEEVEKMQPEDSSSSKSAPTKISEPVVGFEADILQIKELLAGPSIQLQAISIVGMGGIGKTTLARSIYNGSFVNDHFDVRAWTTVAQTYDEVTLLANLLTSMEKHIDEMNRKDPEDLKHFLKQKLYQSLKQRRYLIIMDDVWDTNFLKEFRNIFRDDENGSRIIMTSRLSDVDGSNNICSHIHHMSFLSPEQSWNLLRQKALGEEPCLPEFEEIGWKIVEKCKGLPLALAVIGGVLYKDNKMLEHWKYVEENIKSSNVGNYDDLMEKLSWSYNHLPHHLKVCFLYMAIYPEDYVIHVSHLIRLWLAEGFIKPIPPKNLEELAMDYIEDLISRNMIMVHQRSYYGEIKTCTMHDLMRDLCTKKAREKIFLHTMDNSDQGTVKYKRHLRCHQHGFYSKHLNGHYDPTVRSLLYMRYTHFNPRNINSPLLRVLDASNVRFREFPIEVVELVNLRYLAFFFYRKVKIPASISKLCNLQTLIVIRYDWACKDTILYLPPEMFKMPWLRHLLVDGSSFLSYPCGAPDWKLQELSGLVDFRFTKDAIEKILDLKTLGIVYNFDSGTNWSIYCMENVDNLHQLKNLKFRLIRNITDDARCEMPLNLSFPQKLSKLTLGGCLCSWKQLSMIGSLPNLQVLKLKDISFEQSTWKTNEGEFKKLKFLLSSSSILEDWEVEGTHFPSLECLSLRNCQQLKCIPCGIGEIPTLRDIALYNCSSSVVDSANEILNEQHDFGNESFQLHEGFRSSICFHKPYLALFGSGGT